MSPPPSERLEHFIVKTELEPQLRLYRRLWISYRDFDEARATLDEILKSKLPYPRHKEPNALLVALTTALIVSYARPFINSRGQSTVAERTVPGSLLRVLTSREREMHDALIEMRNREVAHSDIDILELSIQLHPNGDGGISRVTRHPFRRIELRTLNRMIEKLINEIDRLCDELRKQLPLNVWL